MSVSVRQHQLILDIIGWRWVDVEDKLAYIGTAKLNDTICHAEHRETFFLGHKLVH